MSDGTKIRFASRSAARLGLSVKQFLVHLSHGEKWCKHCGSFQPTSDFGRDASKHDGLTASCLAGRRVVDPMPNVAPTFKGRRHSAETRDRMRSVRLGPANGNWKGGVTPATRRARQSAAYRRWRRAVIDRDEGVCQACGCCPAQPHAHHVLAFKTHPHLALEVSNGLTLCDGCHRVVHAQERATSVR